LSQDTTENPASSKPTGSGGSGRKWLLMLVALLLCTVVSLIDQKIGGALADGLAAMVAVEQVTRS
jgi:hypothetical protein